MGAKTSIEWTRGDDGTPGATWNPITGCTKVSPGCDHCYAKTIHERFNGTGSFDNVTLHPDRLDKPLHWRRPRKVFVNSMSDLFHDQVSDEYIAKVFAVMSIATQHTFQVLTKRHARMRSMLTGRVQPRPGASMPFKFLVDVERMRMGYPVLSDSPLADGTYAWPLKNVWLGVSVENQQWADIRIPALLGTPAAVRFLSCEPLLGPVELLGRRYLRPAFCSQCGGEWNGHACGPTHALLAHDRGIGWVIVGGESGPNARPIHPQWARDIRDQCVAAGVPFLFKQWGESAPLGQMTADGRAIAERRYRTCFAPDEMHQIVQVGKKAAGRELDGRTWDEYPAGAR